MPVDSAILERAQLFAGLDGAALETVLATATERRVSPGTILFGQGDEPRWLPLIAGGRVKIWRTSPGGRPVTLGFLGPGEVAGCAAVFRRVPYPATATAVVDSTVLSWTAPEIHGLLEHYPGIMANALSIVGARAEAMLRRIEELSTETVERRIARALLRLTQDAGRPVMAGVQVDFALSRQDLAELCAATLYTVSRTLTAWAKDGIVEIGRQRVVVRDLLVFRTLPRHKLDHPDVLGRTTAPKNSQRGSWSLRVALARHDPTI